MTETAKTYPTCTHRRSAMKREALPSGDYHVRRCLQCGQMLEIARVRDER